MSATAADDFHLLIFREDAGPLVAVTAHERNHVLADSDGDLLPGTYLMLVAITDRFRDGMAPDGRPLATAVIDATFTHIRSRARGDVVGMMVRSGNSDGERLVHRLGAQRVGEDGDDHVYLVTLEEDGTPGS